MTVTLNSDLEAIGAALGRIPSGCSILTVAHGDTSTATLVSWVQQAALEPPCVSVAIKRGRPSAELIQRSQCFLLNVIGDDPSEMFKHFGKGFAVGEDAFAGVETTETPFGPLLEACIAHMGCRVINVAPAGDHDLYIAEVAAAHGAAEKQPYTHLRKSGLGY